MARDSSSLERTKEKPTIHRFKCGLDRGFFCYIRPAGLEKCDRNATASKGLCAHAGAPAGGFNKK